MKHAYRWFVFSLLSVPLLLLGGAVNAQEEGKPDATFHFSITAVQIGIGFTWGRGALIFPDRVYSFDVTGINAVGVGVSGGRVEGEVFSLKNPEDFTGTYKGGGMGMTVVAGGTDVSVSNDKDVKLRLSTRSEGLQMNIGGGGFKIKNLRPVLPE